MKRKLLTSAVLVSITLLLTGCCISHDWQDATCTTPQTCSKCEETQGEALGHTWVEATCSEPKHCSVCGETEGETLDHTWIEATCSEPKHCEVCGTTEGSTLDHTLTEANYQQPATCEVCGETVGEPLTAYFEEEGLVCNAQLDTSYPYTSLCHSDTTKTTTGNVIVSDFETFLFDEEHEALEGYEWQKVTVTFTFSDENAIKYGYSVMFNSTDYYADNMEDFGKNYTVNYNGSDYTECMTEYETLKPKTEISQYVLYMRVPEGYDGCAIIVTSDTDDEYIYRLK